MRQGLREAIPINNLSDKILAIPRKSDLIKFFSIIFILSFASFHYAFNFALVIDDWMQLWAVLYHTPALDHYFKWAPNSAMEFLLLSKLLGFNHFYWQLIGFFLKIIAALSASLVTFAVFRSKTTSFLSGIIYASFVGGIESFTRVSAQNHVLSIPPICLGIYFWITSYYKSSKVRYFFAITFFIISLIGYSGSTATLFFLLLLWELLTLLQNGLKITYFQKRTILLLVIFVILNVLTYSRFLYIKTSLENDLSIILKNPAATIGNFLNSIGNLLIGWIFYIEEAFALSKPNLIGLLAGYLLIVLLLTVFFLFFKSKKEDYKNLIFFLCWILLFYFPSWMASGHLVNGSVILGVTHRYFAIPSIGFVAILAFFISKFKSKFLKTFILITVLSLNIFMANKILKNELSFRSIEVQNRLYNQINETVAEGKEGESVFVFLGNNNLQLFALDWNGAFPFALKRGLTNLDSFPVVANDINIINQLLCGETDKLSITAGVASPINVNGKKFSLENLYAWTTTTNGLQDISEAVRVQVQKQLRCNNKEG